MKTIVENRKARFEYSIIKTIEAGIVLIGDDIKGILNGKCSLTGCFAKVVQGNVTLFDLYIGVQPNERNRRLPAIQKSIEMQREKRLLLNKSEIRKLEKELQTDGTTLIPLSLYTNDKGKLKVELGLCKGKKLHDKKQAIKERDISRETREY
jgi:SsrA-binding protein